MYVWDAEGKLSSVLVLNGGNQTWNDIAHSLPINYIFHFHAWSTFHLLISIKKCHFQLIQFIVKLYTTFWWIHKHTYITYVCLYIKWWLVFDYFFSGPGRDKRRLQRQLTFQRGQSMPELFTNINPVVPLSQNQTSQVGSPNQV
jgi:hypothetical protein